jgi:glycosyltransferase involved in cell wall biosynthesis
MFASYHCYHDPSSGAAVCTRDLFAALAARGWRCGAFTGPYLDDTTATPIGVSLKSHPGLRSAPGTAGVTGFGVYTVDGPGGFPVTIYAPDPPAPAKLPTAEEATGFLAILGDILRRFRPDVVLTYGGDPASRGIATMARNAGARAAFWLHNFSYTNASAFAECDAVIVPSACSREHYRALLGLNCVALPPVIDVNRVLVPRLNGGRYVTFVNPEPNKGIFWFARLAEVLGRARPDIPFLVVEGRGRTNWVGQCGVKLSGVRSIHRMPNTSDPRQFYQLTRLALMPSVWRESFGRVAAEAMLNGIPVLASDRGALPEVVGQGGKCLPIPNHHTSESRTAPTKDEVVPWADALLGLWDDLGRYEAASAAAREASTTWHPDAVVPHWEAFLTRLAVKTVA